MTWAEWLSLVLAVAAGTVWAIGFYMHWSYRFKIRWLGIACEVGFLVMLFGIGAFLISWLVANHP